MADASSLGEQPVEVDADAAARHARAMSILKVLLTVRKLRNDSVPVEVAPRVFLGSVGAAYNRDRLRELGITHVLCVAADLPHPFPADFRYMGVPVLDSPDVDLRPHFDAAFEFMEHAVSSSGGVLVHCFAGRSRSVTICVGYLMRYQTMTLHSALAAVQALRPCAQPNVGFMANLERFEQEEARSRAHGHATRSSTRLTCA